MRFAYVRGLSVTPLARLNGRHRRLYSTDRPGDDVAADVRAWCREHGHNPGLRVVLAGYAGEHDQLELDGWGVIPWRSAGGLGNRSARGKVNATRERLWYSPACVRP